MRRRRGNVIKSMNYAGQIEGLHTQKSRKIGLIAAVLFIIALLFGLGYYIYGQNKAQEAEAIKIEMGDATLPRVVSIEAGYEVNELLPYTIEMDILTMRDTISPLTAQGMLNLEIKEYDAEVHTFQYEVISIDGSKTIAEAILTEWEDNQITIDLGSVVTDVQESLLKITMTLEDGTEVYYYTRLIAYGNCNLSQNMEFVSTFHEYTFEKNVDSLAEYLEETSTSSTLQYVDISSGAEQVAWGELEPTIVGEVKWNITECTSLFISVQLEYQVEIENEDHEMEYYNVVEFYRVGYSSTTTSVQLKQYERTLNQIFDAELDVIDEDGILLGIIDDSTEYMTNEEETSLAFTQQRALYVYHSLTNEVVTVFSLEEWDTEDSRYRNSDYDIRILSVDEDGSVNFVVYGYQNRGAYEGQVGANIYSYNAVDGTLMEKAFVGNTKSFAVAREEMDQGMYYSNTQDIIYIIAQNTFYKVDLTTNIQEVLHENMDETSYAISEDGKLIAYGDITVLDLETGEEYSVEAEAGTGLEILGFIDHDLIYGYYYETDTLLDETDTEITPMFAIEISDEEGIAQKSYENEGQYIRDIYITDNMVTINLLEKEADTYVYAGQDVITNNSVQTVETIEITTFTTEEKQTQKKINFNMADELETLVFSEPQMIINEDTIRITYEGDSIEDMYFAYAYGELQVQTSLASEAIQYASANMGAVVNESQEYVWRSGNRDLTYTVSNADSYATRMSNGESAIEIVSESANQNVSSYTGCTTEQMCYIINQGQVIAAKLEDDSWVLLIGYTGDTMYYLNANGVKSSSSMDDLDETVMELIGDGIF